MYKYWQKYHTLVDSFDILIRNWKAFSIKPCTATDRLDRANESNPKHDKTEEITRDPLDLLDEARTVDALVRDTLQLHIGNVSLQESRKSISQANSVGRVTSLAFIFLPLSLVTSFFGMNIQELNNNGPRSAGSSFLQLHSRPLLSSAGFFGCCSISWEKSFPAGRRERGWIERENLGQWQPSGRSHTSRTNWSGTI